MAEQKRRFTGGVRTAHHKNTMDMPTSAAFPIPKTLTLPMRQHMGAECEPCVAAGDVVLVGQKIGDSDAYISAPVHTGVSGVVTHIDRLLMPDGAFVKTVVIESDGEQRAWPELRPPVIENAAQLAAAARECGLVGLGGAGFPTHVKLSPAKTQTLHTLLVNAAECEPYITSDYRCMLEQTQDIADGIRLVLDILGLRRCIIGVEDNTPLAAERLQEATASDSRISVALMRTRYPQGAENVFIRSLTAEIVPLGRLPADVGMIVLNVSTIAALAVYARTGMPLLARRVTVDGDAVEHPANLLVPIGTPIRDLLDYVGRKTQPRKIMMGGPMMGIALRDEDMPTLKQNNAILAFSQQSAFIETGCIRCGRCVRACPMKLMPLHIEDLCDRADVDALCAHGADICMECGCCSYVCPARRPLVQAYRLAKAAISK